MGEKIAPTLREKKKLIEERLFTKEARTKLIDLGCKILTLPQFSVENLEEKSFGLRPKLNFNSFGPEERRSYSGQIAIWPGFFLAESNFKSSFEQKKMIEEFSKKLSLNMPEIAAIVGRVVDYWALAYVYRVKTRESLFGEMNDFFYTRTQTFCGEYQICVGGQGKNRLTANFQKPNLRSPDIFILPLIVPRNSI